MIVDFHTHVDEAPAYGWIDPPEKLIRLLDLAGIGRAVVTTYVDHPAGDVDEVAYLASARDRYADRLIPFVRLHPRARDRAVAELRRAIALGFRGLKLHPTTTLVHPADDDTIALLRICAEAGVPVLFHCGDDPLSTPFAIALAAKRVPDAQIVLGHMGGYEHNGDAIRAAATHRNVWLETSGMPYPARIAEAVAVAGPDRVLFGSDGPGADPALEIAKIRLLSMPPEVEAAVLGGNAIRLLGDGGS